MGDIDGIGPLLHNFGAERIPRDRHERAKFDRGKLRPINAMGLEYSVRRHRDSLRIDEERAQIFTSENITYHFRKAAR